MNTNVSEPITVASGRMIATAAAFKVAFSSHSKSGFIAGSWISSAGEATTSKLTPACSSNSRRRGDEEASTTGMPLAWRETGL